MHYSDLGLDSESHMLRIDWFATIMMLCHNSFCFGNTTFIMIMLRYSDSYIHHSFIVYSSQMRAFTGLVDTNYILDAIRGSELLEVQVRL